MQQRTPQTGQRPVDGWRRWSARTGSPLHRPVDAVISALGVARPVSSLFPDLGMRTPDEGASVTARHGSSSAGPFSTPGESRPRRGTQVFPDCETAIKIFCECFGRESVSIRANADQRVPPGGRKSGLAPGGDPCKALDEARALRRTGLHVSRAAACSPGHGGRHVGRPVGRPSWFRARSPGQRSTGWLGSRGRRTAMKDLIPAS